MFRKITQAVARMSENDRALLVHMAGKMAKGKSSRRP